MKFEEDYTAKKRKALEHLPAFPVPSSEMVVEGQNAFHTQGMSLLTYAAIHLRVPCSEHAAINTLVLEANHRSNMASHVLSPQSGEVLTIPQLNRAQDFAVAVNRDSQYEADEIVKKFPFESP